VIFDEVVLLIVKCQKSSPKVKIKMLINTDICEHGGNMAQTNKTSTATTK